ncbi:MAG TPA: response regulator transcription factor [Candidatus Acidoferrum sp.]|nr:response regulator transcription factor [Candidatus Acidoferrum sp.]
MTDGASRPTVVIVEDHALTRAGLRAALETSSDVIGEAADGPIGLQTVEAKKPTVAVVDIGLPGFDGIELTRRIREAQMPTRVVVVTMVDAPDEVLAALAAGADAYCVKTSDPERIVDAVLVAAQGGAYFDPQIAQIVLSRFAARQVPSETRESPLTPRETDVLRLIAEGRSNTEIAERLYIGYGTVKGHIRDILEKLSAADRTQAAVTALRKGYI